MMHHRPFRLFILLFLLFGTLSVRGMDASGQEVLRLGVNDAIRLGMTGNRDLTLGRLERDRASEQVRKAWSALLPQAEASLEYTRHIEPTVVYFPSFGQDGVGPLTEYAISMDNAASARLSFSQKLFDARSFAALRASSIVRTISDESYRAVVADVVTEIRKAYYSVLAADAGLQLYRESLRRNREALMESRAMFTEGMAADIDTLKAYLAVENIRPDLLKAQKRTRIERARLKNLLGLEPSDALELTDSLTVPVSSELPSLDEAYMQALDARPDIRQLELQVEAASENIGVARGERYPMLTAVGQLQTQTQFDDGTAISATDWPVTSSVGLQVSLPLFSGYRISAGVAEARIERMQALTRLEKFKADVRSELEVRLAEVEEALARIEVQDRTVLTAERSYRISLLRYREGVGSHLELTDAELQLFKAHTDHEQALYDYLVASAELERSLGSSLLVADVADE
ncbi:MULTISPECIES: TolC family protein [Prosthecochloris]|nr:MULTISPECIES: TolC family protein [Prosthecochloris]